MIPGSEIRRYRKKKNWSQQQLADDVGVSKTTVLDWEKDRYSPTGENVKRLAKSLGISVAEVMSESEEKKHPNLYEMLADRILRPVESKSKLAFNKFLDENPDIETWFRRTRHGDFDDTFSEEEAQVLREIIIEQLKKWDKEDKENGQDLERRP